MYLRISCYCDASSDLRVGVTTLLNTIQIPITRSKYFVFFDDPLWTLKMQLYLAHHELAVTQLFQF